MAVSSNLEENFGLSDMPDLGENVLKMFHEVLRDKGLNSGSGN